MARGGTRYGAGRPGWHVKAEHCLRLDVRQIARRHLLRDGGTFGWHWTNSYTGDTVGSISVTTFADSLRLNYRSDGTPVRESVQIDRTACTYGGTRPWLRCPRCNRRVAVLFLRGGRFVCRHCGNVVYGSQAEDALGRTWRRQQKLESRLGENWTRPKGMHHRTRERLLDGIFDCEERRDDALAQFIGRMTGRF
jgi:hypothetical protein